MRRKNHAGAVTEDKSTGSPPESRKILGVPVNDHSP